MEIVYDPDPTDVHVHERHAYVDGEIDERPGPWIWYYRATIRNRSDRPLRLTWLDAFHFEHGRWTPGNGRGRALDTAAIRELLVDGDLDAEGGLPAGGEAIRPVGWILGEGPVREPVKWAVVAIDDDGVEHYAEAELGLVPYDD
ncbi:MAG: hypothetical protein AAGE94_21280 [Acidobacteriota bacterium]